MSKTSNQAVFASTDWDPEAPSDAPHPEDCRCETCVAACDKRETLPYLKAGKTIPCPEPTDGSAADDHNPMDRFADLNKCSDEHGDGRHGRHCHCIDCAELYDSHELDDDWDFPDDDSPYDNTVEYSFLDSSRLLTYSFGTLGDAWRAKRATPKRTMSARRICHTQRATYGELERRRDREFETEEAGCFFDLMCDDEECLYEISSAFGHEIQEALLAHARHQQQETETQRNRRDNRRKAHEAHVATRRDRLEKQGKLRTTAPGTRLESDCRFNPEGKDGKRLKRLTERTQRRESASPRYLNSRRAA